MDREGCGRGGMDDWYQFSWSCRDQCDSALMGNKHHECIQTDLA
jgi:hypothetical protein